MSLEGKWITCRKFASLRKQNVFHRQLDHAAHPVFDEDLVNTHVLFRRKFFLDNTENCVIRITADDYYKLYINGKFVTSGPAAGYDFRYFYNEIDLSNWVVAGENTIAVHTYYQGMINRVWVSGDRQHGLLLDLFSGEKLILASDESFRCAVHTGFSAAGTAGYNTQFMERYDAGAPECGFEAPDYDDSAWEYARKREHESYTVLKQPSCQLEYEVIAPEKISVSGNSIIVDFGAMFVGNISFAASGKKGDEITMYFAQELNDDGTLRYQLRANCEYVEYFRLSGREEDQLKQYDYKSFRYAQLVLPDGVYVDRNSIQLNARHYPFVQKGECIYNEEKLKQVWQLCVDTLHYGVQEVIQDCMDREKGYYLGDGCYSLLAYTLLTDDLTFMEKFFDDFFATSFINPGLMTCTACSFMQEIAEFPFMMINLAVAYCDLSGNVDFIRKRYKEFVKIMDFYRNSYAEKDGLLNNLDKWCVVEWPMNVRDGYDADITEGKVCTVKHNVINAYYIGAVKSMNRIAAFIGEEEYYDAAPLEKAFTKAFYLPEKHMFKDSVDSGHISFCGNIFPGFYGIIPDDEFVQNTVGLIREKRLSCSLFFATVPALTFLRCHGEEELVKELLADPDAWLNIIAEGGKRTFEGWSKDLKWNTSLFHLTLSLAVIFMTKWKPEKVWNF